MLTDCALSIQDPEECIKFNFRSCPFNKLVIEVCCSAVFVRWSAHVESRQKRCTKVCLSSTGTQLLCLSLCRRTHHSFASPPQVRAARRTYAPAVVHSFCTCTCLDCLVDGFCCIQVDFPKDSSGPVTEFTCDEPLGFDYKPQLVQPAVRAAERAVSVCASIAWACCR